MVFGARVQGMHILVDRSLPLQLELILDSHRRSPQLAKSIATGGRIDPSTALRNKDCSLDRGSEARRLIPTVQAALSGLWTFFQLKSLAYPTWEPPSDAADASVAAITVFMTRMMGSGSAGRLVGKYRKASRRLPRRPGRGWRHRRDR